MKLCNAAKHRMSRGEASNYTITQRNKRDTSSSHEINGKTVRPGEDTFKFMMEIGRLAADLHRLGGIRNQTKKMRDYRGETVC